MSTTAWLFIYTAISFYCLAGSLMEHFAVDSGWIVQRLKARYDLARTERRLVSLLNAWRGRPPAEQAYGPGNVINLLRLLVGELRNVDLSQLSIRQAYLAEVDVQGASLVNAHLTETALAEAFDLPASVAVSGDGALLAIGTSTGQVLLWRLADRMLQWSVQGPTGVVWAVALTAWPRRAGPAGVGAFPVLCTPHRRSHG